MYRERLLLESESVVTVPQVGSDDESITACSGFLICFFQIIETNDIIPFLALGK